ncbi:thermonuclease family protein [Desulfomonile tiedjei]|uniref:Micrococcal nuclease-like nuclease n=1 Tax=Desulfomonile tiedjei (strain ATCC 49306 / DSM 6799 / DCB-1) TaxID=706587 RepID=I4CD66_DESTA|nr:thermonuclease family protein [Desulfomonile tiedjei]AFM27507.1 micrococcal nuclease-like nuclease [Desulfomonile tiedjei DSM 6799]
MRRNSLPAHLSAATSQVPHNRWIYVHGVARTTYAITLACIIPFIFIETCCAWTAKVISVSDGDTITVLRESKPEKIRLYGVDAPEHGQDFFAAAKDFTSEMVFGKIVDVAPAAKDRYGRAVAWVSVDGRSLNKELVKAGLAWWYRSYARKRYDLYTFEIMARRQKLGIWSVPKPTPPWLFRRNKQISEGSVWETGFPSATSGSKK